MMVCIACVVGVCHAVSACLPACPVHSMSLLILLEAGPASRIGCAHSLYKAPAMSFTSKVRVAHGGHARSAGASCTSSALGAAASHPRKLNVVADCMHRRVPVYSKMGSWGPLRSCCSWAPYRPTPTCSLCVSLSVCTFRRRERPAFLCAASFQACGPQLADNFRRRSAAAALDLSHAEPRKTEV